MGKSRKLMNGVYPSGNSHLGVPDKRKLTLQFPPLVMNTRYVQNTIVKGEITFYATPPYMPAIIFLDAKTHEPVMKATTNPEHVMTMNMLQGIPEDAVAIKNYSENEGVLEWLIKIGCILPAYEVISQGWGEAHMCKFEPTMGKKVAELRELIYANDKANFPKIKMR